ncbi:hypothetical protein [Phyllobacterium myrsinacearum]|uniref:hypothetical protein n=1 Tax=Phyllobacterium myrsinacearum TaxID=28101 RepID=UPI003CCA7E6A
MPSACVTEILDGWLVDRTDHGVQPEIDQVLIRPLAGTGILINSDHTKHLAMSQIDG